MVIKVIAEAIRRTKPRSKWDRGVKEYALELLDLVPGETFSADRPVREQLLRGAENWKQFSYGAGTLVESRDIAERLCTPTQLKLTDYGEKQPNTYEGWLDVQARALQAASILIQGYARQFAWLAEQKG